MVKWGGVKEMGRSYLFCEEEIEEIQAARKKNKNQRAEQRLKALELRAKGKSREEISQVTGLCKEYVSQLVKKYREKGLEAITRNHYGGNHRNMSKEKEEAILAPFKADAEKGKMIEIHEIAEAYQAAVETVEKYG